MDSLTCPHCHKELEGKACPDCSAAVPVESQYCMYCGSSFDPPESGRDQTDEEETFDLDSRVLCPDGTCTGIILDGKCTECGAPFRETE